MCVKGKDEKGTKWRVEGEGEGEGERERVSE